MHSVSGRIETGTHAHDIQGRASPIPHFSSNCKPPTTHTALAPQGTWTQHGLNPQGYIVTASSTAGNGTKADVRAVVPSRPSLSCLISAGPLVLVTCIHLTAWTLLEYPPHQKHPLCPQPSAISLASHKHSAIILEEAAASHGPGVVPAWLQANPARQPRLLLGWSPPPSSDLLCHCQET